MQDIVNAGLISDAQLETVVYANMRFRTEVQRGQCSVKPLTGIRNGQLLYEELWRQLVMPIGSLMHVQVLLEASSWVMG